MPGGWYQVGGKPVFMGDDGLVRLKGPDGQMKSVKPAEAHGLLSGSEFDREYAPATAGDIDAAHAEAQRAARVEKEGVTGYLKTGAESAAAGAIDAVTAVPRAAIRAFSPETANTLEQNALSGRAVLDNLAAIGGELLPGDKPGEAYAREYTEGARERAEDRPGTATAGRIAGEIAGTVALPGGGLASGAAKLAEGSSLAARAATRIGAMAAEGGAAASTQAGEDAFVGDIPLTSEAAASAAMTGIMFGGAAGAVGEGLGAIGRKVFGRAKPVTTPNLTKASDDVLAEQMAAVTGEPATPAAVSAWRRMVNKGGRALEDQQLSGKAPEEAALIRKVSPFSEATPEREAIDHVLHDYDGSLTKGSSELSGSLNKLENEAEKVREVWDSAPLKESAIREKITTPHGAAVARANVFADQMRNDVNALLEQVEDAGNKKVNEGLRKVLNRNAAVIDAMDRAGETDAAKALTSVYQMKQAVQRVKKMYSQGGRVDPNAKQAAELISRGFDAIQNDARKFTESPAVWGEAGNAVKEINERYTAWLPSSQVYRQTVMQETQRAGWDGAVHEAWDEKIRPFLEKIGTGQASQREEYVRNYITGLRDLSDTISKHFDVTPGAAQTVKESAQESLSTIQRIKDSIGSVNKLKAMAAAERGHKLGGIGGALVGAATPGAATHGVSAMALNRILGGGAADTLGPGTMAVQAAQLRAAAAQRITQRAETIVRDLVKPSGAKSVARQVASAGRAASPITTAGATATASESADARYRRVAERLVALQGDPEMLNDAISAHMGPSMPELPQTQAATTVASARAISYMASKLPAPLQQGGAMQPLKPSVIAPSVRDQFMRTVDAVMDPVGVMEKIGDGSLTKEHVEAVKAVWPTIYSAMRDATARVLLEGHADAPYQVRLQSQKLFDLTLEPTASPAFAAFIRSSAQAAMASAPKPRRSSGGKSSVVGSLSQGSPTLTRI